MPNQREEILLRSFQYIRENGVSSTSMRELAVSCGLSKAGIYHHFTSKSDLVEELIIRSIEFTEKEVFATAYRPMFQPKKNLEDLLNRMKLYMLSGKGGCFLGNTILELAESNPKLNKYFEEFIGKWTQAFAHIYQSKFSSKKSLELALFSFQLIEGTLMSIRVFKDKSLFDRTALILKDKFHES